VIHILLPAYNEAEGILDLLREIEATAPSLDEPMRAVVVDDGSTDGTAQQVRSYSGSLPVELIEHEQNRGLAGALETGIAEIMRSGHSGDQVVTMDADLTHSPRYIPDLHAAMTEEVDVVVASRYAAGGKEIGVSGFRRLLSHGAAWFYRFALGDIGVHDFSCGYRMIRWDVLRKTWEGWGDHPFESPGFACTGELLLKTLGYSHPTRFVEIPFVLHYERKRGESKMPTWRTVRGTLGLLLNARRLRQPPGNSSNGMVG